MKKLIAILLTVGLFAAPMAASAGGRRIFNRESTPRR